MNTLPHNHDRNIQAILGMMPDGEKFSEAASVFAQLGDGTRLKILWLLCHTKECVSDIAAALGVSKAVVSHHLQLLRRENLVTGTRSGQEIHYSLSNTDEAKFLHATIEAMFNITCPSTNIDSQN
ncbi:MAG: winged helix-turn-helix transcriptional regulator [Synergistaceae bacterium]|nr:winged helix-turn-helix transcriptional regulator [Synergistaceae bacterium]MBQ7170290.1 winged helix-turn-helix transcriptional regulator [Synergistaceae bacterium]